MKASAKAVQAVLDAAGVACFVEELPASTRTANEAAAAIGCDVRQIAKTIVFRNPAHDSAVIVITSGVNQVDVARVAGILGEKIERATPDFVREATGFAIGGVPPCGHAVRADVLIDQELTAIAEIWAAAGTPNAVFRLTPDQLVAVSGGRIADVAKRA